MICYIYIRNTFEMNMTGLKQFYMEFSIKCFNLYNDDTGQNRTTDKTYE